MLKPIANQLYNIVTNEEGDVVGHGLFPGMHSEVHQNNVVQVTAEELERLRQGAVPILNRKGGFDLGEPPTPPPPPPEPTEEENAELRALHAKVHAKERRRARILEVAPITDQLEILTDFIAAQNPEPLSPAGELLTKIQAVKAEHPKLTEREAKRLEVLLEKYPHLVGP